MDDYTNQTPHVLISRAKYLTPFTTHTQSPKARSRNGVACSFDSRGTLPPPALSALASRRLPLSSLCCCRGSPERRRRRWPPTCRDSMALFPSTRRPGKAPRPAGQLPPSTSMLCSSPAELCRCAPVTMQVRGDRGDRGGAVLLLRGVGAEPKHGSPAPVAGRRAPVQRL